ncbi:MAG: Verru_Chthon cassette protein B [Chthoniobacteraceae bacterium]
MTRFSRRNSFHASPIQRESVVAFSLVEVCVALGIVTFCMLSLLGLLPVGLRQERQSFDQIRAAHILGAVSDEFQGLTREPDGTAASPAQTRFGLSLPAPGASALDSSFYLDEEAEVVTAGSSSSAYVVHYSIISPDTTGGVFSPYKIRVIVAWPGAAEFSGNGASLVLNKATGSIEATLEVNSL